MCVEIEEGAKSSSPTGNAAHRLITGCNVLQTGDDEEGV
jgi:hypothetical protein